MGRPNTYTPEELLDYVRLFQKHLNRFPSRDDLKGKRKIHFEGLLTAATKKPVKLPQAVFFERAFGSWQELRDRFGEEKSKYTPGELAEKVSMDYAVKQLGMEPADNETSVVDGYIGDEAVEVKGATLSRAGMKDGHYRFRWNLHYRELSKLVDRLILVGVLKNGEIACVLDIRGRPQLADLADNRRTIDMGMGAIFGTRETKYWPYVTQLHSGLSPQNIEEYV